MTGSQRLDRRYAGPGQQCVDIRYHSDRTSNLDCILMSLPLRNEDVAELTQRRDDGAV